MWYTLNFMTKILADDRAYVENPIQWWNLNIMAMSRFYVLEVHVDQIDQIIVEFIVFTERKSLRTATALIADLISHKDEPTASSTIISISLKLKIGLSVNYNKKLVWSIKPGSKGFGLLCIEIISRKWKSSKPNFFFFTFTTLQINILTFFTLRLQGKKISRKAVHRKIYQLNSDLESSGQELEIGCVIFFSFFLAHSLIFSHRLIHVNI